MADTKPTSKTETSDAPKGGPKGPLERGPAKKPKAPPKRVDRHGVPIVNIQNLDEPIDALPGVVADKDK